MERDFVVNVTIVINNISQIIITLYAFASSSPLSRDQNWIRANNIVLCAAHAHSILGECQLKKYSILRVVSYSCEKIWSNDNVTNRIFLWWDHTRNITNIIDREASNFDRVFPLCYRCIPPLLCQLRHQTITKCYFEIELTIMTFSKYIHWQNVNTWILYDLLFNCRMFNQDRLINIYSNFC